MSNEKPNGVSRRALFLGVVGTIGLGAIGGGLRTVFNGSQLKVYDPDTELSDMPDFEGFNPNRNTVILFAAANRIDLCAEGADVMVNSVDRLTRDYDVVIVMPDIGSAPNMSGDNSSIDHRTLDDFAPYIGQPNFQIVTGSNDDVAELAKSHGAEYLFLQGHVWIHTPYPFLLKEGEDVARELKSPLNTDALFKDIQDQLAYSEVDDPAARFA